MDIIYNAFIHLFIIAARVSSLFSPKAKVWLRGQAGWEEKLKAAMAGGGRWVWMHCASLGEFEQGRPVLEAIRKMHPEKKILLTFFSPSGYEVRKNYSGADYVCYLPADTRANAQRFLALAAPELVIFVKYEFWNNYITLVNRQGRPFYLISAIFRPTQHFFKFYGAFFRRMLQKFTRIFVQDGRSAELLAGIGIANAVVAGDTRFDRVLEIAGAAKSIDKIEAFRGKEKLFIAGSSWKPDEEIIAGYINSHPSAMKWIFAPHEIHDSNLRRLEGLLKVPCVRYSEFAAGDNEARVMIIDNIGMLSSAYRYAAFAAVGGGFGKGIHNVLEPACWGIPVLFGPNHGKFREAVEMRRQGGAFVYGDPDDFEAVTDRLLSNPEEYEKAAFAAGDFVKANSGATAAIMKEIFHEDINNAV